MGCGYSTNNVIDDACGGGTSSVSSPAAAAAPTTTTTSPVNSEPRDQQAAVASTTTTPFDTEYIGEEVPPTITVNIPSYTGTGGNRDCETITVIVVHFNPSNYTRRATLVNECISRLVETQLRLADINDSLMTTNPSNNHDDTAAATTTTQSSSPPQQRVAIDITVVELCYGSNEVQIDPNNFPTVKTICCRCDPKHIMWSKEQLINIALDDQYISPETKYVVWMDSDIAFTATDGNNKDQWVYDVVTTLSQHELAFGQIWSTCDMLGPVEQNYEPKITVSSFCAQYAAGKDYVERHNTDREYWHPGFGWMATISALRITKGLISQTLGSADRHMAMSFMGSVLQTVPDGLSESYLDQILTWQEYVQDNQIQLVHIPNSHIVHYWHGPMEQRKYMERFDILKKYQFDPMKHLRYHYTGLYLWSDACPPGLMTDIANYFKERNEDSNTVSTPTTTVNHSTPPVKYDNGNDNNDIFTDNASAAVAAHNTAVQLAAAANNAAIHATMNNDDDTNNNNNHDTTTGEEPKSLPSSDPLNIYA